MVVVVTFSACCCYRCCTHACLIPAFVPHVVRYSVDCYSVVGRSWLRCSVRLFPFCWFVTPRLRFHYYVCYVHARYSCCLRIILRWLIFPYVPHVTTFAFYCYVWLLPDLFGWNLRFPVWFTFRFAFCSFAVPVRSLPTFTFGCPRFCVWFWFHTGFITLVGCSTRVSCSRSVCLPVFVGPHGLDVVWFSRVLLRLRWSRLPAVRLLLLLPHVAVPTFIFGCLRLLTRFVRYVTRLSFTVVFPLLRYRFPVQFTFTFGLRFCGCTLLRSQFTLFVGSQRLPGFCVWTPRSLHVRCYGCSYGCCLRLPFGCCRWLVVDYHTLILTLLV